MSNRTIEAILRLSSKLGSMAAFRQLSGHLDKVDNQARAFNRRQGMIAAGARDMQAMLLRYAAPAALVYGAKEAYVEFAELERRMTRIGITAGANVDETRAAFDLLQRSAKDFALPIDEAVSGLDTLVSSGMDLKEAMAFLPSVLATAQAAGAATADIANTAQKASSALKIEAADMQRAFDIMVTGGKAGQFELKDMATYIPELANSFASLGYSGEAGLKELVAVLQTIREDTGSAGAAATQAQNIFGKMFSSDTEKKFSKFGINLRKELDAAKKSGEGVVQAFVRLSKQAVNGDLSKLPLLFTDQEFRLGMQSLMTSADSYKRFIAEVNGSKVDGSTMRDLGRVLADNQSKIDKMSASWGKLKTSFGGTIAGPVGKVMDFASEGIDYSSAIEAALEKKGVKGFDRLKWWLAPGQDAKDDMAWAGGYRSEEQKRAIETYGEYARSRAAASATPDGGIPIPTPRPDSNDGVPIPMPRPDPNADNRPTVVAPPPSAQATGAAAPFKPERNFREFAASGTEVGKAAREAARRFAGSPPEGAAPPEPPPSGPTYREAEEASMSALRQDHGRIANEIETALASGGDDVGQKIRDAASEFAAAMGTYARAPSAPDSRDVVAPARPTYREAEEASMSALRQDHGRIANEIETALASGGDEVGQKIRDAASEFAAAMGTYARAPSAPDSRDVVAPARPTYREAEEASMSALRQDHGRIANEIEMALASGAAETGRKAREAAGEIGDAYAGYGRKPVEAAPAVESGAAIKADRPHMADDRRPIIVPPPLPALPPRPTVVTPLEPSRPLPAAPQRPTVVTPSEPSRPLPAAPPRREGSRPPSGPTYREAEEASMSALRQDHGRIANEIEMALSTGGADAGAAITDAARAINEAGRDGGQSFGSEAGSTFSRMLEGMADQFGARAAASFRQSVGTITVNAAVSGGGLPAPSGVRGRTMPDAGSTRRGPN